MRRFRSCAFLYLGLPHSYLFSNITQAAWCQLLLLVYIPNGIVLVFRICEIISNFAAVKHRKQFKIMEYIDTYGVRFSDKKDELIECPDTIAGEYIVPDSVIGIEPRAFEYCKKLKKVIVPDSVVAIGENAFAYCSELESIELSQYLSLIENETFYACELLKSITIPNSVSEIGKASFASCSALRSIVVPDGVDNICDEAFRGCESLESITLPMSLEWVGTDIFLFCDNLKEIIIPSGETERFINMGLPKELLVEH